jgi:hypothetical protein
LGRDGEKPSRLFFARSISAQKVCAETNPAFIESTLVYRVSQNAIVSQVNEVVASAIDNSSGCD